ncbi:Small secreted domain [Streptomyces sp. TLI_053]|uniref:chaplin n=1 Tax=Streptomyces sp. TLI_053 TaxID=1855352 RepID=UPI00087DE097|nr:chaplin [Streptomyces sp. TLI_053]SDT11865.1 Small secreted domain [Streptomyces sp. TLI_053]
MTDRVQVRNTARTTVRRRMRLGIAALAVAALPLAALSPARAADQEPAAEAPSAAAVARETSIASELAAMGLQVRTRAGVIVAWGPADIVNAAVTQFADQNPFAMFTEPDQNGQGYIGIRGTSIARWIGFTPGSGVAIQSVSNESDDEVIVYDQPTGHLNIGADHHTAENLPDPHATSAKANRAGATHGAVALSGKSLLSGDQVQIPINVEPYICGNSVGVLSVLHPAFAKSCISF